MIDAVQVESENEGTPAEAQAENSETEPQVEDAEDYVEDVEMAEQSSVSERQMDEDVSFGLFY